MKMPAVTLSDSPLGPNYVAFRTECGSVCGTAKRATGQRETHYDISQVHPVKESSEPYMRQLPGTAGSFDVIGIVTFCFDDGVSVLAVQGFEFWIEPEECSEDLAVGMTVALQISNLTLYI